MRTVIFFITFFTSSFCIAQQYAMETRNRLLRERQTSEATWMTHYNLAYVDIAMTFAIQSETMKIQLLDEADKVLIQLEKMKEADSSEIEALKAFRFLSLMNINTAVNGPKFAADMTVAINKALKQNPDNPRAIILLAIYQKNMAGFMNKEYEKYCQDIQRAKVLLERQDTTRLVPTWGMNWCKDE